MSWIKVVTINLVVLFAIIFFLELFAGLFRIFLGSHFIFPHIIDSNPCEEMKTDVLLNHVPNHPENCKIKDGYVDGEYVRYNIGDLSKPVILSLGGSTTSGFFQEAASGDTYPKYLSQLLASEYQILNGGVAGYSSLQELFKVIRDAPRIKNLHTVVSLNGINDIPNYHGLNEIRKTDYPFLSSLQAHMNYHQTWIDQRKGAKLYSIFPNITSFIRYLAADVFDESNKTNLTLNNPIILDAGDRWELNIRRMHAVLQTHGVRYFVFLQPTMGLKGLQSSPKKGSKDEEVFKLLSDSDIQEIRRLYAELRESCLNLSYCFDISNKVTPSGNNYSDPRHHNSEGNRLLAQIIADKIHEQDLNNSH